ncbi:MAG: redoxin domain-containing protein [Actinobacteria bacterium]|nr:redoxin domain-containing protein [Actinomycetota bacterium]
MTLLVLIAFIAGMVTGISPCILPVFPIIVAASATGGRWRPYAVVGGLVVSFTVFTLAAAAALRALGLPTDLLRNVAIAVVLLLALSLLWPRFGHLLERPFQALGRRRPGDVGGGFMLGLSLGVLFTPCAGPIIAAIATLAASEQYTLGTVAVTLAYSFGHGLVLLGLALAARRGFQLGALKRRAPYLRRALGGVIAGAAVFMILGLDLRLAARVPAYTRALQGLEESAAARSEIEDLLGRRGHFAENKLEDYGTAPEFTGIALWLNSQPLSLAALRGKVVLIDFWTYSCINCLRTLPYVKGWDAAYRADGLVVVGVHTPEFAFEHSPANVRRAVKASGIEYAVALDNDYATWDAWANQYWPAKYLIDGNGHVRYAHFGEGKYAETEEVIRTLLAERGLAAPVSARIDEDAPEGVETPETYLGHARVAGFVGSRILPDQEADYRLPSGLAQNTFGLGGRWTVEAERIFAGRDAQLRLAFHARKVFLVLGSAGRRGSVDVSVDGKHLRRVAVDGHRLYELADLRGEARDRLLDLRFSPGVEAYAFTFG